MIDLSIIIVNWNTRDLLAQCLESIRADLPDCESEIWVLDNASVDSSAAMVRQHFPLVHLIENSQNVGFARANNQAIRASRGQYVLLLNSDTVVQPGAITEMMSFMNAHPEAGIVGANILNPDGTPQSCYGEFPSLLSEAVFAWGLDSHRPFSLWFAPQLGVQSEFVETDWVIGAALMARREALGKVGLLDEDYFMYSEEIDFAYRIKRAGWKNYVLRSAQIIHLGQQSTRHVAAPMKAELFRSKVKYFQKHHGAFAANMLRLIFGVGILGRRLAYGLRGQQRLSKLWTEAWKYFAAER